jgi:hypothetical protein
MPNIYILTSQHALPHVRIANVGKRNDLRKEYVLFFFLLVMCILDVSSSSWHYVVANIECN